MVVNVIAVSYGIAAAAFLLLTLLLMTSWRGRLHGIALAVASCTTALWAGVVSWQAVRGIQLSLLSDVLELARNAAWTFFMLLVLDPYRQNGGAAVLRSRAALGLLYVFCTVGTIYTR
ncbi:MAG TPA: hypothetical protein VF797_17845, partial [Noviherbaspirillum sp.]